MLIVACGILWPYFPPYRDYSMDHGSHADPSTISGHLVTPTAGDKDGMIALNLPGTDYQLHLAVAGAPATNAQKRVTGKVVAQARRVDIVNTGGVFIEPVIGRPRRLQGRVVAQDAAANTLTIKAVAPFVCKLDGNQKAEAFPMGALVSFDIERGALFEPIK